MTSSHFNNFADENHQKVVLSADSRILLTVESERNNHYEKINSFTGSDLNSGLN